MIIKGKIRAYCYIRELGPDGIEVIDYVTFADGLQLNIANNALPDDDVLKDSLDNYQYEDLFHETWMDIAKPDEKLRHDIWVEFAGDLIVEFTSQETMDGLEHDMGVWIENTQYHILTSAQAERFFPPPIVT